MSNTNPLYSTPKARLDTMAGDIEWWNMLQKAIIDYKTTGGSEAEFQFWLTEYYGIKIYYGYDGILSNYDITDEQKHLLFKLKYA